MATQQPERQALPLWLLALVLTLAHGLAWWAITPPWAAPDEPGHYLYARLLADLGRRPTLADLTPEVEAPVLASLAEHHWWTYNSRPRPAQPPARLRQDPVLAASGVQIEDEPYLFYIVPALWLRYAPARLQRDPAQALRWLRLWPLLLRLAALGPALALARRLWPRRPGRATALILLVGMLPMVGFIGSSFNNAALALAWGAFTFWALALRPVTSWPVLFLVLLGPLVADLGLLLFWPLAAWRGLATLRRSRPRLWAAVWGLAVLALIPFLLPNPAWAASWRRAPETTTSRAEGALALQPAPGAFAQISQIVAGKEMAPLRGQLLHLRIDVLSAEPPPLQIEFRDDGGASSRVCAPEGLHPACDLFFTPAANASFLRLAIGAGERVRFRLALFDRQDRQLLYNADGRSPTVLGSPLLRWLEMRLPIPAGYFERLLSPSAWDAASQIRYVLFAGFTGASFWGYFGWLSRPLPWWNYLFLAGLTLLAGWGLSLRTRAALRRWRRRRATPADRLLALTLAALLLGLFQIWAPMLGQAWQPQGRYLFPALLPIALCLLVGWEQALPLPWRRHLTLSIAIFLLMLNLLAWRAAL